MKHLLTAAAVLLIVVIMVTLAAENNYNLALTIAAMSDGTDADIANTLGRFGFADRFVFDEPTLLDKVFALFN